MKLSTLAITACAAALLSGTAWAEKISVAHGLGPTHLYHSQGLVPYMQCVRDATGNAIEFEEYPSGQIVTLQTALDSLLNGVTQMSTVITSYESGRLPIGNALLMPGQSPEAMKMHEAYREVLDDPENPAAREWAGLGIVPLLGIIGPGYQLMTTGQPLDSLDRIAGAKIRGGGGVQILTLQAIGATPIDMAIGDLYVAMQRGTVDGTILGQENGPAYKLEELVKSVSRNASLGYGQAVWAMPQELFSKLAPAHQQAFRECGRKVEIGIGEFIDRRIADIRVDWAAKGVTFYDFSEEALAALNARAASVADRYIGDLENRGVVGAREAFEAFRAAQNN